MIIGDPWLTLLIACGIASFIYWRGYERGWKRGKHDGYLEALRDAHDARRDPPH